MSVIRNWIGHALDIQAEGRQGFKEEMIKCSQRSSKMRTKASQLDLEVTGNLDLKRNRILGPWLEEDAEVYKGFCILVRCLVLF